MTNPSCVGINCFGVDYLSIGTMLQCSFAYSASSSSICHLRMDTSASIGPFFLAALAYFLRLQVDYLLRVDMKRSDVEEAMDKNEAGKYDFVIGEDP